MPKIIIEVDAQEMLTLAQELEKKNNVKGIRFKYNSITKKFIK